MKRYIHDGVGLRVMRGQENHLATGAVRADDFVCPCGYAICKGVALELPEGWAPCMGGYVHPSGAEVQARGEMWAWFPKGMDTCPLHWFKGNLEEAMIAAHPRWDQLTDLNDRTMYMRDGVIVYTDGEFWWHTRNVEKFYLSPEAAMVAAERMR